jgi:hypothetical protein
MLKTLWVRQSIEPGQTLDPTSGLLWWVSRAPARYAVDDAMVIFFSDRGMTPASLTKLEVTSASSWWWFLATASSPFASAAFALQPIRKNRSCTSVISQIWSRPQSKRNRTRSPAEAQT